MNNKIVKLKEWGCNVNEALERLLNDEDFYLDCLNAIAVDENFELLKESLEAKDVKKSFDYAHTIKGVVANLSITPMYNKIVEIVEPLRIGNQDNLVPKVDEIFEMRDYLKSILESE